MESLVLIKWVEAGLWLVSIKGTYCNWTESFARASHWPESILKAGLPQLEAKRGQTLVAESPEVEEEQPTPVAAVEVGKAQRKDGPQAECG